VNTIYHITRAPVWHDALQAGVYEGDTLESEGFIHCSTREQVMRIANGIFRDADMLVLLFIDESRVRPDIRYENLEGGTEDFPHIYGPLNIDAVKDVKSLSRVNGEYVFPESS
jgi:uncharacterized protein (DUF952 family)